MLCNDCMRAQSSYKKKVLSIAWRNYFQLMLALPLLPPSLLLLLLLMMMMMMLFGLYSCLLAYSMDVVALGTHRLQTTANMLLRATPIIFQLAFNRATRMSSIPIEKQYIPRAFSISLQSSLSCSSRTFH